MIIRTPRKERFTVIDNRILEDTRLSFKAKGILCYLLSRPDDWSVNDAYLSTIGPDGEAATRSALKELELAGYLVRKRVKGERGRFEWITFVYDEPQQQPSPWDGFPPMENPPMESPWDGFPPVDCPPVENPPVINTDIPNTEEQRAAPSLPARSTGRKRSAKKTEQIVLAAAEAGISPKLLTQLTNTILDITGLRALADAGDDLKLRDAQEAAIQLRTMGYGTVDSLKDLRDAWVVENSWRDNKTPTLRAFKEFASRRATESSNGAQGSAWEQLSNVPDYLRG